MDLIRKPVISVITDVAVNPDMGYTVFDGGFMSRPLLKESAVKNLRKIQTHLDMLPESAKSKVIQLPIEDAKQLSELINDLLSLQPVVYEEEYLTPNDASEMVGVSRPVIVEMLKNKALVGHQVGTHWKIQKKSLLNYMNQRDKASRSVSAMDEDGFGLD